MLPGVYMVKFDMLNPNLTSKMAKTSTRAENIGTDVRNRRSLVKRRPPMFFALVEVFGDFRRRIRIQHVKLYHIDPWKHRKYFKTSIKKTVERRKRKEEEEKEEEEEAEEEQEDEEDEADEEEEEKEEEDEEEENEEERE